MRSQFVICFYSVPDRRKGDEPLHKRLCACGGYMACNNHSERLASYKAKKGGSSLFEDDTIEALLEPCHGVLLLHPVLRANTSLLLLPPRYPSTWPAHDDVEIHSENTDTRVVPGTEIDVLLNTETEVAGLGEVLAAELVLLDLEAALEDLLSLGATDGDVDGDLLVTTDAERADGVAGLGGNGGLTGELLQNLGGTSQTITGLADGDVEDELVDPDLLHGVGGGSLLFGLPA